MLSAIDYVMNLDGRAMGIAIGLGVMPGTELARLCNSQVARNSSLNGFYVSGEALTDPTFFVDPSFAIPDVFEQVRRHVGSEVYRVMLPDVNSTAGENNQLVGSQRIEDDIERGKTGAYWYHYPDRRDATRRSSAGEETTLAAS